MQRYATEDTEVEGVAIPAGAVIDVCIGSANRDEQRWERSEEFDIFRKRVPHLSFAAGEHTCMGLHLARMETRVAVECLLNRLTDIKLITDDNPHICGQPFRSPTAIPVTFDAGDVDVTDAHQQRRRRERGSISVDEILNGAFEVAAEVSIGNLSMPLLARAPGYRQSTSIYWYFRKKDELLDAMTDRALDAIQVHRARSIDASNWRESLRNHAHRRCAGSFSTTRCCATSSSSAGITASRAARRPARRSNNPSAALVEAGLTSEQAVETYGAISVHTRGSVVHAAPGRRRRSAFRLSAIRP